MKTMPREFDVINAATGFASGDEFASEQQVREYFTVAAQVEMFGRDAEQDQAVLDGWAAKVIANRWQMS